MRPMGRPRKRHKDLPRGLYKDAVGRFSLKAFTPEDIARLDGKTSMALGRDPTKARTKWAEVFGFRDHEPAEAGTLGEIFDRFIEDDLPRIIKGKKGKPDRPKYAASTKKEYLRIIGKLRATYGTRKYAHSEAEAARGGFFRTMDVSAHLRDAGTDGRAVQGNRDAAVLGSVFRNAKESGLTEYNPCLGASRNPEEPRDQEMHDAIFLELYAEASPVLQCLMDLDVMVGSRVRDLLNITEFDWTAAGLMAYPSKRKQGQPRVKQLFERTPDLEEVFERAAIIKKRTLARDRDKDPNFKPVKSTYIFVSGPDGKPYTDSGFQSMMRADKRRVARKRLKAQGVAKPKKEQLLAAVQAIDIHFHDGRARAGQDAADSGQNVADFFGHTTQATSRRHYLNRKVKMLKPNPRIRDNG